MAQVHRGSATTTAAIPRIKSGVGLSDTASADYAQSYLLVTILAAVLGGVDPFGGFGAVAGLMLALAILQVISSGFNQFGLSNGLTLAIWGRR